LAQKVTLDSPTLYQQLHHASSDGEAVLDLPQPIRMRVPIVDVRQSDQPRQRLIQPAHHFYLRHRGEVTTKEQAIAQLPESTPIATKQALPPSTSQPQQLRLWSRTAQYLSRVSALTTQKVFQPLQKVWRKSGWYDSPLITKILVVMAVVMFITGMAVAVRTLILNNEALSRTEVLATGEATTESSSNSVVIPSEEPVTADQMAAYTTAPDLPRYISIPLIGIRAIVKPVSVEQDGAVGVPSNVFMTSWFDQSAKPSDSTGALLITGHYSGPRGVGIFHDLNKLDSGDIIEIEQGDGTLISFRVVEKLVYQLVDVEMAKAITSADPAKLGLNLMTCEGHFDRDTRSYDHRLLIRAVEV